MTSVLLCDDVRVEQTGKHILIGVYVGNIVPHGFPAALSAIFWLSIENLSSGYHAIRLLAHDEKGTVFADFRGSLDVIDEALPTAIYSPRIAITYSEPGSLALSLGLDGEEPQVVFRRPVVASG